MKPKCEKDRHVRTQISVVQGDTRLYLHPSKGKKASDIKLKEKTFQSLPNHDQNKSPAEIIPKKNSFICTSSYMDTNWFNYDTTSLYIVQYTTELELYQARFVTSKSTGSFRLLRDVFPSHFRPQSLPLGGRCLCFFAMKISLSLGCLSF